MTPRLLNKILDDMATCHADDVWQRCEAHFSIKFEDPEIFVGLAVDILDNGTISMMPSLPSDPDCRYQHWCAAIPEQEKIKNVSSQIAAVFDRTLNTDPVYPLIKLCKYFKFVGYSAKKVAIAVNNFAKIHPYLLDSLKLAHLRVFKLEDLNKISISRPNLSTKAENLCAPVIPRQRRLRLKRG